MKKNQTPEKIVGSTANLIIFLGILYTCLSVASLSGCNYLSSRGYGITTVLIGCTIVGLGYGTRYGSNASLYTATFLFGSLALYFAYTFFLNPDVSPILRSGLCIWASSRLVRTVREMKVLKETGSSPDKESRYKSFFLKKTGQK